MRPVTSVRASTGALIRRLMNQPTAAANKTAKALANAQPRPTLVRMALPYAGPSDNRISMEFPLL